MEKVKTYNGIVVPMVSPVREDASPDLHSLSGLVERVVSCGAHPFLFGTTGEAPSLSEKYREAVVEETVRIVAGRSKVYTGISGNCLEDSVRAAKKYADSGADVMVAHVPCYFPLEDELTLRYFEKLADQLTKPLILYNIPSTTHYSVPVGVVDKLSYHSNIAGIKDSEMNVERMEMLISFCKDRADFSYLLGWAARSVQAMKAGADGIVPSTGNAFPGWYVKLLHAVRDNNGEKALKLQQMTDEVTLLYQKERSLSHSIPALKVLLSVMDLCLPWVLPPLIRMDRKEENHFREQLKTDLERIIETAKDVI